MRFRLSRRSSHGWRRFAGEVGIIVVGVGIALAAEQVVDDWHWRSVVREQSRALDEEVREVWDAMSSRVAQQPCIDRRLAELAILFERRDSGEPLGITGPIGRPRVWTAGRSALAIATADGAIAHMPLERKQSYFAVYGSYETFEPSVREERASWRALQALNRAETLTDEDWRIVRTAYDAAVDSNITMKSNLQARRNGQWLTAFNKFPRWPINREPVTLPSVRELCEPFLSA
jgi:hypothetical protein